MDSKLKVGVMGLSRGHVHALNALKAPNVELTAVCDIDRQRVERQRAAYPDSVKVYYDHREL